MKLCEATPHSLSSLLHGSHGAPTVKNLGPSPQQRVSVKRLSEERGMRFPDGFEVPYCQSHLACLLLASYLLATTLCHSAFFLALHCFLNKHT